MTTFTKAVKFIATEAAVIAAGTAAQHFTTGGELLTNIKMAVITVLIIDAAVLAVKAIQAVREGSKKHAIPFKVPEFQI